MKTLIINGSPRKNGDTVALIKEVSRYLEGEINVISTYYDDIKPCIDCRYCWTHPRCSITGESIDIYKMIMEADNIILASPIYYSELSGSLLNFASRLQFFYTSRKMRKDNDYILNKKYGGLILVAGGDTRNLNKIESTSKTIFNHLNVELVGKVYSLATDTFAEYVGTRAKDDEKALSQARILAEKLNDKYVNITKTTNIFDKYTKHFKFDGDIISNASNLLEFHNMNQTKKHSVNVAKYAIELAQKYDINIENANITGCLHDISAIIPNADRLDIAEKLNLSILDEEKQYPMLLHQKLSKVLAKQLFNITDESILDAIECHTTLKSNPTKLDMLLFIADKIKWDGQGEPPYLNEVLTALDNSLEEGCLAYIDYLLHNKNSKLIIVHPWLKEAYEFLTR